MNNSQNGKDGFKDVFKVDYLISTHLMGGVSFTVRMLVNTQTNKVVGMGKISQATKPPLNILTNLKGDWSYMCTMSSCNILVVAEGTNDFNNVLHGTPPEALNTKLRMSLEDNWKKGIADFQYLKDGKWIDCPYAKVELIEEKAITSIEELAKVTTEKLDKVSKGMETVSLN